jgi:hypothetical protein
MTFTISTHQQMKHRIMQHGHHHLQKTQPRLLVDAALAMFQATPELEFMSNPSSNIAGSIWEQLGWSLYQSPTVTTATPCHHHLFRHHQFHCHYHVHHW